MGFINTDNNIMHSASKWFQVTEVRRRGIESCNRPSFEVGAGPLCPTQWPLWICS